MLDPRVLNQTPSSAGVQRYATGMRNMVALATDASGQLFGVQMDRDNLAENWPALYSSADDARLPAEEFLRIDQGADYGWPYCYYDATQNAKVLAPEYGGDKMTVGRCADKRGPLLSLPAHWAPLSMTFYQGSAFPARHIEARPGLPDKRVGDSTQQRRHSTGPRLVRRGPVSFSALASARARSRETRGCARAESCSNASSPSARDTSRTWCAIATATRCSPR
jgi:hypothetical protein